MSIRPKGRFGGGKNVSARGHNARSLLEKGPSKLLAETLALALDQGAAVMFGATRDGNTLIITLLDGDLREKVYIEDMDDYRQTLTDLAATVAPDEDPTF